MSTVSLNAVRNGSLFGPSMLPPQTLSETPCREWLLDLKYPVVHIMRESLTSCLSRPFRFLTHLSHVINPDAILKNFQRKSVVRMTRENIQSGSIFSEKAACQKPLHVPAPSSAKLLYVFNKVEEIAKKMGLKNEIHLHTGPERIPTASFGSALISKPAHVFIDAEIFHLSFEEIDFVLGHEIAHIYHNDCIQDVAFEAATIFVELIFVLFISPLSLIVVEPLCNTTRHYSLFQGQEYRADQRAMQTLKCSAGAVRFFGDRIKNMKALKNATCDEFLARLKPRNIHQWNARKVAHAQEKISPLGNNRSDLNHPRLTDRLKSALEFRVRGECAASA